jgi:dihydrofolate synthase / folylpolyglutamate synthase
MTYQATIEYLYAKLPVFHRIGKKAYKADLTNTLALCEYLGNPQHRFKSVHVAGTNGKGSSSHTLAAILQCAGYKTGLYTSPHLKSFTERIRINGLPIPENQVVEFVATHKDFIEELAPSFFELSVGIAFDYFAKEAVEVAVIEVGLGGRLDSTNIITPDVCLITNIGWDHADILGDTLEKIAFEKAGIIKPTIPVVVSERQPGIDSVFIDRAETVGAPLFFAQDFFELLDNEQSNRVGVINLSDLDTQIFWLEPQLTGWYQRKNLLGVLQTVAQLRQLGYELNDEAISQGVSNVANLTGLKGRWQILSQKPLVVCDTAHNEPGLREVLNQFKQIELPHKIFVIGFVADKDLDNILKLFPTDGKYYFCEPNVPRKLAAAELCKIAQQFDLVGQTIPDVNDAIQCAKEQADPSSSAIFVGGSTFVVAAIETL